MLKLFYVLGSQVLNQQKRRHLVKKIRKATFEKITAIPPLKTIFTRVRMTFFEGLLASMGFEEFEIDKRYVYKMDEEEKKIVKVKLHPLQAVCYSRKLYSGRRSSSGCWDPVVDAISNDSQSLSISWTDFLEPKDQLSSANQRDSNKESCK